MGGTVGVLGEKQALISIDSRLLYINISQGPTRVSPAGIKQSVILRLTRRPQGEGCACDRKQSFLTLQNTDFSLLSHPLAGVTGEHFFSRFDRGVGVVHCNGDLAIADDDQVEWVEFLL